MSNNKSIYFAGELFSLKHLVGNALLAEAIDKRGGYRCILPQNLEQRESSGESIRNVDLLKVAECDLGLFNFDGPDVDSGTVVEYIIAKMLDIPTVQVRTDFRRAGDDGVFPWNLMMSYFPRNEVIQSNSIELYQQGISRGGMAAASSYAEKLAGDICAALTRVAALPPRMTAEQRTQVYNWFRFMPGESFSKLLTPAKLDEIMHGKIKKGLL